MIRETLSAYPRKAHVPGEEFLPGDRVRYESYAGQGALYGTIIEDKNAYGSRRYFRAMSDAGQPEWTGSVNWSNREFTGDTRTVSHLIEVGTRVSFQADPFHNPQIRHEGVVVSLFRDPNGGSYDENHDLIYIREEKFGGSWQRSLSGRFGSIKLARQPQPTKENALSVSTHNALDLINAVRDLPPSSSAVTKTFADKILAAAGNDLTIDGEAVAEIVNNWPDACQEGRDSFLRRNNVTVTPPVSFLTVPRLGQFVSSGPIGVERWLYGEFNNDAAATRHWFGEGGVRGTGRVTGDANLFNKNERRMRVCNNVQVNMELITPNITEWKVEVDATGSPWAIAVTNLHWGHDTGFWCLAFGLPESV